VEGWNRRISTCSSRERQKQFAGGAGGFVVLFRGSSMVVMITVVGVMSMITVIRVTRAGSAVMPGA
jgi:hypothetical protein